MVDHIQNTGTNPLANALTNAASQAQQVKADNENKKAGGNPYAQQTASDGSSKTTISAKARLLSQALQFARQVPANSVDDVTGGADKVTSFKKLYEAGGTEALLSKFDSTLIADDILNSPVAAFLRK